MKILFISNEYESLGIEYLSAVLKRNGHETFMVLDPGLFSNVFLSVKTLSKIFDYKNILFKRIKSIDPDLICFSVCSDNLKWALNLSIAIKQTRETPVIFGGIHPTIIPEQVIKYAAIDYVCEGEGEEAILELADAIEKKRDCTSIPNIWAKRHDVVYSNPPRPLINNLNDYPFPDKEIYEGAYPAFMRWYTIITSRGCPDSCSYCVNHQIRKLYKNNFYRRRSVVNVIDELSIAKEKYNIKVVRFFDDIFTSDKNWLKNFCIAYKKEIKLPYFCFVHPNYCDKEIIALLEESGCATAFLGFGTFSDKNRRDILRRNYSNLEICSLIKEFKKTKVFFVIDLILGLPKQDKDEIIQMADFFNNNRPDLLSVLFLRYYPKTDITAIGEECGLINKKDLELINETGFKNRIIIEKNFYKWLKKVQILILFSRYLPKQIVKKLLDKKIYLIFPAFDCNNISALFNAIICSFRTKKRINTDILSPCQYLHFYLHYMKLILGNAICSLRTNKSILDIFRRARLIYKLGFSKLTLKKVVLITRYLFMTKLKKKDIPGVVILGLTYKCQCKCVHCAVGYKNILQEKEMGIVEIKSILNQMAKIYIPNVIFFGGEPLILNSQLVELVRYASRLGLNTCIDTNGILLSKYFLKQIKNAGVNNINISLDSANSVIHDGLRGFSGSFGKAMAALGLCKEEKISFVISTYASKRALYSGDLQEIIRIGKRLNATAVKILFPIMSGRWSNNFDEALNAQEKEMVLDLLDPGFVYLESPLFSIKGGKKVCEAINKKMFYISPCGDAQICYAIPVSFGNIKEKRLGDIIDQMWSSVFFRSIDKSYDCVMSNPVLRQKFPELFSETQKLPISCKNVK
ncbi:MAG: radical SAM protein [Candidatus Omnitrophota bacterium]